MKLLYLGDIMGKPGRTVVAEQLPALKREFRPDVIVAQAENVSHGAGMTLMHMRELQALGIDFFTGGNHSVEKGSLLPVLDNPSEPVIRPANLPKESPGLPYKYLQTKEGDILFVSLLGAVYPKPVEMQNPLHVIDAILAKEAATPKIATIVNFHGDMSSDKRVIGYYLDGRVTAVLGDHWHVPTADAMILPKGTAHISDVGMCGTLHSSLGVTLNLAFKRWRDGYIGHNVLEERRPFQLNAVLVEFDQATQLASSIKPIQIIS